MIDLTRRQRLSLLALRQGGDHTGKLARPDWPEYAKGLIGFAIIVGLAYAALWALSIIGEVAL